MSDFNLKELRQALDKDFASADSTEALEALRIKYLGRKGIIAQLTAELSGLPLDERKTRGREINILKGEVARLLAIKDKELSTAKEPPGQRVDLGLPGIVHELGHIHPITQLIKEISQVFLRLGFQVVEGPEIESEYNNFTGLNIPLEHPSRDVFDTFYLRIPGYPDTRIPKATGKRTNRPTGKLLLRSHTSPVQIRVMQKEKPPLAVVVPGRVYRPDAVDASHSFMFHQIEGFMVDKDIRFSDLKGVLTVFAKNIFGKDISMRFRPHFFPFTEPSAEVDISCIICRSNQKPETRNQKKHCSVCAGKGWLEILGAGMIHPQVFKNVGYDPERYRGFAFGMGIERIAMLKYGIDDIRLFFENDLRFLRQF